MKPPESSDHISIPLGLSLAEGKFFGALRGTCILQLLFSGKTFMGSGDDLLIYGRILAYQLPAYELPPRPATVVSTTNECAW